ncbi:hypothetical protein PGTUg99_034511 [Puccinia graminis f. sp. tritici]|uniref:Uncharacterized protein n=1 Tax=Puccinia graminis f. sp. tritici TaxID=56615 RepID=A0A5B0P5N0_PUCGR|nr:hypothetical protein PGTUg99_034511 [Puccinia graminis f. sp. tritici]
MATHSAIGCHSNTTESYLYVLNSLAGTSSARVADAHQLKCACINAGAQNPYIAPSFPRRSAHLKISPAGPSRGQSQSTTSPIAIPPRSDLQLLLIISPPFNTNNPFLGELAANKVCHLLVDWKEALPAGPLEGGYPRIPARIPASGCGCGFGCTDGRKKQPDIRIRADIRMPIDHL